MKIAIPVAQGRLSMHFGHCEAFAIIEVDEQDKRILNETLAQPPGYEPGMLPRWLNENGVSIVLAGAIGQRAQQFFAQFGISVLVGAPVEEPRKLVTDYLSGELACGGNICDH